MEAIRPKEAPATSTPPKVGAKAAVPTFKAPPLGKEKKVVPPPPPLPKVEEGTEEEERSESPPPPPPDTPHPEDVREQANAKAQSIFLTSNKAQDRATERHRTL